MDESPNPRLAASLAGRYALGRELGRGGMAVVYLAEDVRHHRPVAIKVLEPELLPAAGAERFLREIEIAARLTHPHILPLLDSGSTDDLLYYVMPYVEGSSLRERISSRGQLPVDEVVQVGVEIAEALEYAHAQGVVHRDIKPENVLLAGGHALVADFGIARALWNAGGSKLTSTGMVIGTPVYMSPEQGVGGVVDERTDVYALACVLYEALAGAPPFTASSPQGVQARHQFDVVPPIHSVRPGVPEALEQAVLRGLAKSPADRFATAREFAQALKTAAGGTPVPTSGTARAAGRDRVDTSATTKPLVGLEPRRGGRAWRVPAAIGVLLALGAAGWFAWSARDRPRPVGATRDWIIVADFEGPANDPELAIAARDLLSAALDQSEIVVTVPRDQLRRALRRAGKPDTSRIDMELAQELAYRGAIRAVVAGQIQRLAGGFSTVVRVMDAESSRVVLTVDGTARDAKELIPSLERLGRRLRQGLGESREAIRAARPLTEVTTPSFEAFRYMVRAGDRINGGFPDQAIAPARAAIALDPEFSAAWRALGLAYGNLGFADSAYECLQQALRHRDRLEEWRAYDVEGHVARMTGDMGIAAAAFERGARAAPQISAIWNNYANALAETGKLEEAVACLSRGVAVDPLGSSQVLLTNLAEGLVAMERVDEARRLLPRMDPVWRTFTELSIATALHQWRPADSIASRLVDQPGPPYVPIFSRLVLACGELESGRIEEASHTVLAGNVLFPAMVASIRPNPGASWPAPTSGPDTPPTIVGTALFAIAAGSRADAERAVERVHALSPLRRQFLGLWPRYLDAALASKAERWSETVEALAPHARPGAVEYSPAYRVPPVGSFVVRWTVANAFEALGQPDSAVTYFELALAPAQERWPEHARRRGIEPYIHRRLALLHARLGHPEDAERHGEAFLAAMTRPDPELQPWIDEMRRTLATTRAMSRPTRL